MPRPILLTVFNMKKKTITTVDERYDPHSPFHNVSEIIKIGISFKDRVNLYAFMSRNSRPRLVYLSYKKSWISIFRAR